MKKDLRYICYTYMRDGVAEVPLFHTKTYVLNKGE